MKNPLTPKNAKLDPKTIEAIWTDHLLHCGRCRLVDLEITQSLVHCCPEGAQYIKVFLEKKAVPVLAKQRRSNTILRKKMQGDFIGTRNEAKTAMRYK